MIRVAPFASVKSVSAHIELQTVGGCGLGIGMSWSSAWIGCADSPGSIEIEDAVEREEVVDPERVVALEGIGGGFDGEEALESFELSAERIDELGLDRVGDDRVPLLR